MAKKGIHKSWDELVIFTKKNQKKMITLQSDN